MATTGPTGPTDPTANNNERTFATACAALYSPAHQSVTQQALQAASARRTSTVSDMRRYLARLTGGTLVGSSIPKPPGAVRIVHVTGTKGKGSVSCLVEAVLRERYGLTTGLFTSPHLRDIRERIRINGRPVSHAVFAQAYWEVRDRLESAAAATETDPEEDWPPVLPGYFRMLTLVAWYIFEHHQPAPDVWILEVGMGGRYDATNCWDIWSDDDDDTTRTVCGVTLLDLDHTRVLGTTLPQIAWEKGGIFQVRKGSDAVSPRPLDPDESSNSSSSSRNNKQENQQEPALSSATTNDGKPRFFALHEETYPESVRAVLETCAAVEGQGQALHWIGDPRLIATAEHSLPADLVLGLPGKHQRRNAELAVALCQAVVQSAPAVNDRGTAVMYQALQNASWPGRGQTVQVPNSNIFIRLDGAHTGKSLLAGWEWFQSVSSNASSKESLQDAPSRVLIFNCSHERNPVELLSVLLESKDQAHFDRVYFCRADSERPSAVAKASANQLLRQAGKNVPADDTKTLTHTWQDTLAEIYSFLEREAQLEPADVAANLNAAQALERLQDYSASAGKTSTQVFVTGSLYLVGSILTAVQWSEPEASGCLLQLLTRV